MFKFPKSKVYEVSYATNNAVISHRVTVYNDRGGIVRDVQPRLGDLFSRIVGRQHFSVNEGWNPIVADIIVDELTKG